MNTKESKEELIIEKLKEVVKLLLEINKLEEELNE